METDLLIRKPRGQPTMLYEYLNSRPSVTDRLAMGIPAPDIGTKRDEVQNMLDEWQGFGVGISTAITSVEGALRKLDGDLSQ